MMAGFAKGAIMSAMTLAFTAELSDTARRIFSMLRAYRWRLLLVGALSIAVVVFDLLSAGLVAAMVVSMDGQSVINVPVLGEVGNPLLGYDAKLAAIFGVVAIMALQLCREGVLFATELTSRWLSIDLNKSIRSSAAHKIMRMPYWESQRYARSDLIYYANSFCDAAATLASDMVRAGSLLVVLGLYSIGVLATNPVAFAYVLAVVCALIVLTNFMVSRQQAFGAALRDLQLGYHGLLQDTVHGLRDVTLARGTDRMLARIQEALYNWRRVRRLSTLYTVSVTPVQRGVALVMTGLGLALLVSLSPDGNPLESMGSLLIVIFLLLRMYGPISQLNGLRSQVFIRMSPTRSVLDFLESTGAVGGGGSARAAAREASTGAAAPRAALTGRVAIEFDRVSYSYDVSDGTAVNAVSFDIPEGEVTTIVGPSGSGKSTIVDLLTRLREPDAGEIRVNGSAMATIPKEEWWRSVAVIHQEGYLFHGTIADNISMFQPYADRATIEEAARQANLSAFLSTLPDGLDTRVGGAEMGLSGGQKQRLQIARAFFMKPALLVLDEALSAQDAISEDAIINSVKEMFSESTVIVVAHRFSSIRDAKNIVVFEGGEVVQRGDWRTLSKAEGVFKRLLDLQSL